MLLEQDKKKEEHLVLTHLELVQDLTVNKIEELQKQQLNLLLEKQLELDNMEEILTLVDLVEIEEWDKMRVPWEAQAVEEVEQVQQVQAQQVQEDKAQAHKVKEVVLQVDQLLVVLEDKVQAQEVSVEVEEAEAAVLAEAAAEVAS